jgi:hypothetical protein
VPCPPLLVVRPGSFPPAVRCSFHLRSSLLPSCPCPGPDVPGSPRPRRSRCPVHRPLCDAAVVLVLGHRWRVPVAVPVPPVAPRFHPRAVARGGGWGCCCGGWWPWVPLVSCCSCLSFVAGHRGAGLSFVRSYVFRWGLV